MPDIPRLCHETLEDVIQDNNHEVLHGALWRMAMLTKWMRSKKRSVMVHFAQWADVAL